MDPFSLIVGVGSLIELSLALGKCLKDVYEAAASFEGEIGFLLSEIRDLDSVNKAIDHLYRTETGDYNSGYLELPPQDLKFWQNAGKNLHDCSETVEGLKKVLFAIIGDKGPKVAGKRDAILKQLRMQAKHGELNKFRLKLSAHRESLNVSLTLLNLTYSQKGSKNIEKFGFQLHRQIASLQSRLPVIETDTLNESLHSATSLASTLRLNRHFDTPKTVSSIYTGRKGYLDGLKQAFSSSHSSSDSPAHKRFVVFGLGGSGKTQFCCKFASDNKQRFWGVFTIDASSPGNAQQSFIAIAKACGTDPNERAAKSWLSSNESCDRPWLLIIDNADDTNLEIERYFPDGMHGLTLITTRNPSVKMHGTIGQRYYHFDRLDDSEASELLLKAADNQDPRTPNLMQLASTITRRLGALPLALVHAGNAIKAKYCELGNYISYYEQSWHMIRQSQRMSDQDEDDAEYMKVYASYEIVFRGLEAMKMQRYQDAVQLLKLFSFLHHEHIPFDLLITSVKHPRIQREADRQEDKPNDKQDMTFFNLVWQFSYWRKYLRSAIESALKKQFENQNPVILPTFLRDAELSTSPDDCNVRLREALHILTQLSLVTYYESSDGYSMHPLVHTWVRERPQMTARDQAVWCEAALNSLSRCVLLPPLNETVDSHRDLARKLLPHIISVGKLQQKIEREFASNRNERNRPWPALKSQISPWRAMFLAKSALIFSDCGEFAEAGACLRVVMDFNNKLLGPNHPRTERAALALSDCLSQQCRVNEAADLQEHILQSVEKALGPDDPRTLRLMIRLGDSRRQQGRFAESIDLLTRAMDGTKIQLSDTDPARYHVLEHLGITMRACFRFEDARQYQEQGVTGMKLYSGAENPKTLAAIEDLAITYMELGTVHLKSNQDLAHQYLETARNHAIFVVEQRIKQLGERQPHTWMAQGTLARIKAAMGNVDEAEKVFSSNLPVAARHLGDNHLGVLSHKNHYSKILIQQQRYREAEALLLDTSQPDKYKMATLTGDHPDRWDALWTLTECYQKQGKIDRSLTTCNELLEAMRAIRQGKEQTEMSSTFWEMVQNRRTKLMTLKESGTAGAETSPPEAQSYSSNDTGALVLHSEGVNIGNSNVQGRTTPRAENLKHRVNTW
ncbi:hypothetical protein MMC09_003485 [Bachmanniomyces sp. S44760]|nr:hypothetical protein [Bachmanniomyces sp. S44760]